MKPIDYRTETWESVQARLNEDRMAVYEGLRRHGPCTTRELAAAMEWDAFSVRPRVTELFQLGLAELADTERRREGTYRALPMLSARNRFEERKKNPEQMMLI